MVRLAGGIFSQVVERLPLAVFLFRRRKLSYSNEAGRALTDHLRSKYNVELSVLLTHHLTEIHDASEGHAGGLTLLRSDLGEPFYVHVTQLGSPQRIVLVTVRRLGTEMETFRQRYQLSRREAEVVQLVLHGYSNRDVAAALGIATATAKKHLSHVFDKVGVDSRARLTSLLA